MLWYYLSPLCSVWDSLPIIWLHVSYKEIHSLRRTTCWATSNVIFGGVGMSKASHCGRPMMPSKWLLFCTKCQILVQLYFASLKHLPHFLWNLQEYLLIDSTRLYLQLLHFPSQPIQMPQAPLGASRHQVVKYKKIWAPLKSKEPKLCYSIWSHSFKQSKCPFKTKSYS
jgi:hypothetical protein